MKLTKLLLFVLAILSLQSGISLAQNWEWAVGGKGYDSFDYSNAIAVDNSGNVYIAGYFQSPSLTFGTKKIDNLGKEDIFVAKFDPQGNCIWNLGFGGSENDRANCMTIVGNFLVLAGYFESNPASFGNFKASPIGGSDVFIAVINTSDGNVLQLKTFGGEGYDDPNYIYFDPSGNLYIAGEFSGDYLVFGSDTVKNYNYGTIYKGMGDGFLVKYSSNGTPLWGKSYGGVANDRINACVVDDEGMLYIYGTYNSNKIAFTDTMFNKGYSDIFLAKYDEKNNKYIWQMELSGTDKEYPASIIFGRDKYIYITGEFQSDELHFKGNTFTNQGSYDFFIIKLDKDGNIVKARSFGSYADEYAKRIIQNSDGSLFIGGYFASSTLNLDNITLTNSGTDAYADIFVAKFDTDLNPIWAQTAGGKGEDQSFAIAVFGNDLVYQTGNFSSKEIVFNKTKIFNYGYSNVFLAKLNPDLPLNVENNQERDLIVFPNPTTDFVRIISMQNLANEKGKIYNTLGKLIEEVNLANNQIDLSLLPSGFYILKIKDKVYKLQKI
ncbi:MAG: hypothetical protein CH6_1725 [Candidatus Kapaibacterium sp.]|nr:MAG: hypothetical protein CH6_1725 [Candidatus Kapabacteria bacterium]